MFFFFNDTATTEIYTLSLHDALPILPPHAARLRNLLLHARDTGDHAKHLLEAPQLGSRRGEIDQCRQEAAPGRGRAVAFGGGEHGAGTGWKRHGTGGDPPRTGVAHG